jgi:hypothetical protein
MKKKRFTKDEMSMQLLYFCAYLYQLSDRKTLLQPFEKIKLAQLLHKSPHFTEIKGPLPYL